MVQSTNVAVMRTDLSKTKTERFECDLQPGQVLVKIDRFALTANNITYGVVGEKIGYWKFFPVADPYGIIPVWGFGDVVESTSDDIALGERLYGYFPMGTHLVITPDRIKPNRLIDGAPHRAALPPVYNAYARVNAEPEYTRALDDARIVLYPLYATSFCLHDFMIDNDWFGADKSAHGQVIIPSASSKTAIGLAYAIAADNNAPEQIGLTSPCNLAAVKELGLYDRVLTYNQAEEIESTRPAVIIDMSGNGPVLGRLHKHLGDQMRYCSNVGLTHFEDNQMGSDFIRERSAMFFAPGHIQKRTKEWGPGIFEQKAFAFWKDSAQKSEAWLSITHAHGVGEIESTYRRVLSGKVPPSEGCVVVL